jgi:hypothetical protein
MSNILTTYSAKDLNMTFTHPLIGTIQAAGVDSKGIAQINVRMTTAQSVLQVGMDGAVVPSVVPGDQGEVEIQVWQTSTLHQQLLAWYNALKAARDAGDVSQWFSGVLLVQNIVDGTSHTCTGVAPQKVADKSYQEQAQRVNWLLVACSIVNE